MSPQGRKSQGPEPTVLVTEPSLGERVWGTKLCLEVPRKLRDFECPSLVTCAVCEAGSVCPTGHSQPCPCPTSSPCSSSKHAHSPCCTLPHLSGVSTFPALLLLPAHDGGRVARELRAAVVHTLWWTLKLMVQLYRMREAVEMHATTACLVIKTVSPFTPVKKHSGI